MLTPYYTIKHDGSFEIIIKKSRFICTLKRIENETEATDFIHSVKKEHYKANHNCSAYILRTVPEISRSSDDGEPSGTAGIPMLEVLHKNNLTNVVAVTTRYFGGTKLGAGGLIRAYASSISEALHAIGIVIGEPYMTTTLTVSYANHGAVTNFLTNAPQYQLTDTAFTENVTLTIMVKEADVDTFSEQLTNLLSGNLQLTTGAIDYLEIPFK